MHDQTNYDIIIIGGGIQGAGVAQAATLCGYKTLLIEKFPQAGMGTSCKSSKLIHGGLRYLESGQFKLVRECLVERKYLLRNAPDLVKLNAFYIPVYSHSKRPSWLIWLGLMIYSLFSFKAFSSIKKPQWQTLDGIEIKNLKSVFRYYDAQTDDQKLTRAVISSAEKHGAKIIYNAEFLTSQLTDNIHSLSYKKDQQTHTVTSRYIINCSGPWVETVQNNISPALKIPQIDLVAGSHIIIDSPLHQGAYYLEAADKRAVFVLPWNGQQTLIGTTERLYTDNADDITPSENEIAYLLEVYNQHFKNKISVKNIVREFAGLRVLPADTNSVFNKSRETLLIHNPKQPGLITLVGGKLTVYRATAEKVINIIKSAYPLNKPNNKCSTKDIKLD